MGNNPIQKCPESMGSFLMMKSIYELCNVPTVPLQDWATRAASAVVELDKGSRACVMLVRGITGQSLASSFRVETAGASICSVGFGDVELECTRMQGRAERVRGFGISLSEKMLADGVVARMSSLSPGWRDTGLGRVWSGIGVGDVFVGVIPIDSGFEQVSLVVMLGTQIGSPVTVDGFAAIAGALSMRATAMLSVMSGGSATEMRWLTSREQDVLDELIKGHSVRQIAEQLGRSHHTVHDHVKSLHKKLHASSRGELVAAALGSARNQRRVQWASPVIVNPSSPLAEMKLGAAMPQQSSSARMDR